MGVLVSNDDCRKGKTVVISPHPDDETIGCGGWLIKRKEAGQSTVIIIASRNQGARLVECARALEGLKTGELITLDIEDGANPPDEVLAGAAAAIAAILATGDIPSRLFVPNIDDIHPIHRYAHILAVKALRDCGTNAKCHVFQYEGFTPLANPNRWLDITAEMKEKRERLGAYRSQQKKYPLTAIVESLNAYRGATLFRKGVRYAEAYRMMETKEYLSCKPSHNC